MRMRLLGRGKRHHGRIENIKVSPAQREAGGKLEILDG
jgi:hypothetical protein